MKKRISKILLLFLLLLSSCTKTIEIDLPAFDPKPVINCLFSPDSTFKLRLSRSASIFDTLPYPSFEMDAVLRLYENEVLKDTMFFDGQDFRSDLIPKTGSTYRIEMDSPDFGPVSAKDFIPEPPIFQVDSFRDSVYVNEDGEYVSQVKITIDDDFSRKNYYELILLPRAFSPITGADDTLQRYVTFALKNDPVLENEGILQHYTNTAVFSNELFSSGEQPLIINYLAQEGYFALVVILRTVSEDYYRYKKSLIIHINSQDSDIWDGIGAPTQMISNINGGYGIFAGYSEDVKIINK